jgi:hypothetical protein
MKAKITVVFHMEYEVLDRDEEQTQFFIEENHCIDNVVRELAQRIEDDPGYCQTCNLAEAYVGHIPFAAIREAQRSTSVPHTSSDKETP